MNEMVVQVLIPSFTITSTAVMKIVNLMLADSEFESYVIIECGYAVLALPIRVFTSASDAPYLSTMLTGYFNFSDIFRAFFPDLLKLVQFRFSPHKHWGWMLMGRLINWLTQSTLATRFGIEKLGYMCRTNRFASSKLSILFVIPLDYGGLHNPIYRKKKETVRREIYISA